MNIHTKIIAENQSHTNVDKDAYRGDDRMEGWTNIVNEDPCSRDAPHLTYQVSLKT